MSDSEPLIRVVRGNPTAEELAALVAAVATRSQAPTSPPTPRSTWRDPAALLRRPIHPGPQAWRRHP